MALVPLDGISDQTGQCCLGFLGVVWGLQPLSLQGGQRIHPWVFRCLYEAPNASDEIPDMLIDV